MSLKRISSSGRFIKRNGLLNNPWPEVWAEEAGRHQIDPTTEKIRQLGLEGNESKTDGDPGLELDKDVEIAPSLQLAPDCRPKHCESADAVAAANTAKGRPIEGEGEQTFHETMLAPAWRRNVTPEDDVGLPPRLRIDDVEHAARRERLVHLLPADVERAGE
jgi:hypothetical protein